LKRVPVVKPENCIGCRICELICSSRKGESYNPRKSAVRVIKNDDFNVNIPVFLMTCDECETVNPPKPRCEKFCPMKAIRLVDATEAALLRKSTTIGEFPAPRIRG